jgi:uncharacterized phage infection (PIP) family protein YhgE
MDFNPPVVANPDGNLGNDAPAWAVVMQDNLNNINNNLNNINNNLNNVNNNLNNVNNNLNNVNNNLNNNHTTMMASIANIEALSFNSTAADPDDAIAVIRDNSGHEPPGFPGTLRDFHDLTNQETNALLAFYGVEVPDVAAVGKRRLRLRLGIGTMEG